MGRPCWCVRSGKGRGLFSWGNSGIKPLVKPRKMKCLVLRALLKFSDVPRSSINPRIQKRKDLKSVRKLALAQHSHPPRNHSPTTMGSGCEAGGSEKTEERRSRRREKSKK